METLLSSDFSPKNHFSFLPHKKAVTVHPLGSADLEIDVGFNQPKRLQCYELYWMKRGAAPINIDTATLELRSGSIYCLSPGQVRQLDWGGSMEGFYMSICPDFFNLLQNRFEVASVFDYAGEMREIEIKEGLEGELEQIIDKIRRETGTCSVMQSDLLRAWLNIFMLYLTQCMSVSRVDSSPAGDRDLLKRFLNLLPSHHSQKKMVSEYAEILCVTPNYLNSVVKKITGFPASHHIQQYLVMEAKRYAMYSQLRMKEIANRLGFVDYAHFSKYFKNYAGVNFSNYLKEINTTLA